MRLGHIETRTYTTEIWKIANPHFYCKSFRPIPHVLDVELNNMDLD